MIKDMTWFGPKSIKENKRDLKIKNLKMKRSANNLLHKQLPKIRRKWQERSKR